MFAVTVRGCYKTLKGIVLRNTTTVSFSTSLRLRNIVNEHRSDSINSSDSSSLHLPVMVNEVLSMLNPQPGQTFIDMTFGAGGHTRQLLESSVDVNVLGLDRDPVAHNYAKDLANQYPGRFTPLLGRFSELPRLLKEQNVNSVDGILFDLGCSSMQFDEAERGFSISHDGPLDMRMDGIRFPDQPTAADVIEHIDEHHLAKILKTYGEEKQAKKLARAIVEARYMFKRLKTTSELAYLVESVLDKEKRLDKLARPTHVATKTFQAIRIFVNNEMNELNRGIEIAQEYLKPNGTLVVLTFHSLEDRIVKRHLVGIDMDEPVGKGMSQKYRNASSWYSTEDISEIFSNAWQVVNKHVLVPSVEEVEQNSRSRSAKLRCARKNPSKP